MGSQGRSIAPLSNSGEERTLSAPQDSGSVEIEGCAFPPSKPSREAAGERPQLLFLVAPAVPAQSNYTVPHTAHTTPSRRARPTIFRLGPNLQWMKGTMYYSIPPHRSPHWVPHNTTFQPRSRVGLLQCGGCCLEPAGHAEHGLPTAVSRSELPASQPPARPFPFPPHGSNVTSPFAPARVSEKKNDVTAAGSGGATKVPPIPIPCTRPGTRAALPQLGLLPLPLA